jgi:hypothetical protein
MAKTEKTQEQKETAVRAARSAGFEPAVEQTGSMDDQVAEEKQTAETKIVSKKDEKYLRRDKQHGVSFLKY